MLCGMLAESMINLDNIIDIKDRKIELVIFIYALRHIVRKRLQVPIVPFSFNFIDLESSQNM